MYKILAFMFLVPSLSFCQGENQLKYPEMIGDIEFNKETDHADFDLCGGKQILQYFNNSGGLEYEGEKLAIEKEFSKNYKQVNLIDQTGLIRIRFVVNCKGETDRFRLISMDENYKEKIFSKSISEQLLNITKQLKGWKIKKINDREVNYYQYLIFRIDNGYLKEILP